jgi:hypothetical protein
MLRDTLTFALPYFSSLKTLVIISQPPTSSAYIPRSGLQVAPRTNLTMQRSQTRSFDSPRAPVSPSSSISATLSPRSNSQSSLSNPLFCLASVPDALHERSSHMAFLAAWHKVQPSLERVVFPIGIYTYVGKGKDRTSAGDDGVEKGEKAPAV